MTASRRAFTLRPTGDDHRVTNVELFYDLVFVFALTQITSMIAAHPSPITYVHAAVITAMVWFAWCAYSWLGNQAHADIGMMRACMLTVLVGMFFVAVAIPRTFASDRSPAFVFVTAYVLVRSTHILVYWLAAAGDRELRAQLLRTYATAAVAFVFWFAGAAVPDDPSRLTLWLLGAVVDFVGVFVTSRNPGWRLNAASHFAERYGLIVLIAIGESIVSIGVGISEQPTSWQGAAAIFCGLVVAIALWWLYFDVLAFVAERTLHEAEGVDRVKLARDSFTYLHLPIVVGIVLTALGLKFALAEHHLHDSGAWSLFGGMALYLAALSALRRRNLGAWNVERLAAAALALGCAAAAIHLTGLGQVTLAAALLGGLIGYEAIVKGELRNEIRAQQLG